MIGTSKSIWGFDPRSIPNCIVWLDGGDSNTMTPSTPSGGTQITAWLDKSVNGVSYASGAVPTYAGCNIAPPTYVTGGGLNFNPSIPGGGTFTNNVTQGLSAVGGFPLNATGFTAFAVAASTGTMTTFNSYFSYFTGGAEFIDFDAGGGTFGQITTDTTGLNVNISGTRLTTTRQIQSVRSSTTGATFFVNGSLSNTTAFTYTQVNNPVATVVWVGNQAPGFRSFSGTIFELLVYNQSLSSNQRQTVEGYLARKWAITLATTHPFFVLPPFNRYFNPNDIPGCSLWLDAADNSTMNSTTTVTSWLDKSGLNNTMTGTATWTGSNMSFNGSTQAFSNTSYVFPISAYSMFGVYSNTTAPAAGAYMNAVYGSNGFPMLGIFGSSKFVSARSVVANTGALGGATPVGWAARIASTGTDQVFAVATDTLGNVLVTGSYDAALTLNNGNGTTGATLLRTSTDCFIAKYTSAGSVAWATRADSSARFIQGKGIATNASGNVLVTGRYNGTLNLRNTGDSIGTTLTYTGSATGAHCFVVNYSSAGSVVWATRIAITAASSAQQVIPNSLAIDSSGNVFVTGEYTAAISLFNATTGLVGATLTGAINNFPCCFVVKYTSAGNVEWATRIESPSDAKGFGVATDTSGNVFVIGTYFSSLIVYNTGGTSGATLATGNGDCFLAKYSSAGAVLWAARVAGSGTDQGLAVATDTSGAAFVTGNYTTGTLTLSNANGTTGATLSFAGITDCFVGKYSSTGTVLWAARIAGASSGEIGNGLSADPSGNVCVIGNFSGTNATMTMSNANGTPGPSFTVSGSSADCFIAKYSSAGSVLWGTQITSTNAFDGGLGVATDISGNVFVTGFYSAAVSLRNSDGTTGASLLLSGVQDVFLAKYNPDGFINNNPTLASSNVLVSATYAPSTFSPFANGFTQTTLAGTTLATTGIFVGGPSNYFNGTISELLVYSSTLTAAQRQQVEGYLIDKWSLRSQTVSNHQYRLIPPATSQPPQYTEVTPGNWVRDWQPELQSLIASNNPTNATVIPTVTYGTGGPALSPALSTQVYLGGVLAPNGNIYCTPQSSSNILIINPTTNAVSYGTGGPALTPALSTQIYSGGVLAPNGNIYCVPYIASNILIINPTTNAVSYGTGGPALSPALSTQTYVGGGVLAPNGNIYCPPDRCSNILIINPTTNAVSYGTGGPALSPALSTQRYKGAVLAPNGNIYGVAAGGASTSNILIINTTTNAVSYGTGGPALTPALSTQTYHGGVLAPNGNIYCVPYNASNILIISNTYSQLPSSNYCLSAYANKF